MTVAESVARLGLVLALLVWLPGWLALRRPLWPVPVLHAAGTGLAIHLALLVAAASLLPDVGRAASAVAWGTAVLVVSLAAWRFHAPPAAGPQPSLGVSPALGAAIAGIVALAAALRWLHNYHFDDTQHLRYLTEIERLGVLFPRSLMLPVPWGDLGERMLIISRYPFWAADYVVIARLAGVPLGDAYYGIGLALLALALGLSAALLRALLSSPFAALAGVSAVLAAAHVRVGEDILNYAGYPFQAGKLLLVVSAIAAAAYARQRHPACLVFVGLGLAAAPLAHTNNIVGALFVGVAATGAAIAIRSRALFATTVAAAIVVAIVAGAALASGGFMQYVAPDVALRLGGREASVAGLTALPGRTVHLAGAVATWQSASAAGEAVPEAVHAPQADTRVPGNVIGRRALFLRRGLPSELLVLLVVVLGHLALTQRMRAQRAFTIGVITCSLALVAVAAGLSLGRQLVSQAVKPGYWMLRGSLMEAAGVVRGRHVLTDPITHVLGAAAGWQLPTGPPEGLGEQFARLLLLHPGAGEPLVRHLLAARDEELLVVNEAVVGPATAARLEQHGLLDRRLLVGQALPPQGVLAGTVADAIRHLYALDYASLQAPVLETRRMWRLLIDRPLYVFARRDGAVGVDAARVEAAAITAALSSLGTSPDATTTAQGDRRAFLSTVAAHARVPPGCFTGVHLELEATSSFEGRVLIHVLPLDGRQHHVGTAKLEPGRTASAVVRLGEPVCGPSEMTIFVHGGFWYDFRFALRGLEWIDGASPRLTRQ
jgi:hypothetical protein